MVGLAMALAAYGLIKLCVGPGESNPSPLDPDSARDPAPDPLQIAPQAE